MPAVTAEDLRNMKPLRTANHTVGDPERTAEMIAEDGYLYFKDVLDHGAIARLKQKYIDVLVAMGFVDPGATEPIWNGKDLTNFPVKIEPLHDDKVWESFVAEPPVDDFFRKLLGTEPYWVPVVEYRITPPGESLPEDPFIGRHQDGFYNMGMDLYTCWIPLMEIDEVIGGLAIVPGLHTGDYYHDRNAPPQYRIPPDTLPPDNWHRSTYCAGDLVMFDKRTPHSGLPNTSDRFRLSMDVRVAPISADLPIVGTVLSFSDSAITIRNRDGQEVTLTIDDDTYCRWTSGKRIPVTELQSLIPVGAPVLASAADGKAISLRPPR